MWHLSASPSPSDAQLLAPAHLAALLLTEVAAAREVAVEKGERRAAPLSRHCPPNPVPDVCRGRTADCHPAQPACALQERRPPVMPF
jgi:hypothetical protein